MTLTLTKQEIILGWVYMALQLLVLPVIVVVLGMVLGVTDEAVLNLALFVINAVCCSLIFRRVLKQSLAHMRTRQKDFINATVLGFLGYYAATTLVGMLILLIEPDFMNVNDQSINAMIDQQPLLMFLAVTTLVPLAEECLFRGLIFVPLCRRSTVLAYTVTCMGFAAIHVVGYIGSYGAVTLGLCFVQYLAPGAALCWACKKADSLLAPMVVHALINCAAFVFTR